MAKIIFPKGGITMAVYAVKKNSAYVVRTSNKQEFMNGKSNEQTNRMIKEASNKLQKFCFSKSK